MAFKLFISEIADTISPFSSNMARYVGVDAPLIIIESSILYPISLECSNILFPHSSSPKTDKNFVFIPILALFSAIFLQTPPKDIFIFPGVELYAL